jgi:hypothetical protein
MSNQDPHHDCELEECSFKSFVWAAANHPEPMWPNGLTTLAQRYLALLEARDAARGVSSGDQPGGGSQ